MEQIYENIKKRRAELGISQSELARRLGYADKSMISKIENGDVDLPQSKIKAFADALNTVPGKLMGWIHDPIELSSDEERIVMAYRGAPEGRKEAVRALLGL